MPKGTPPGQVDDSIIIKTDHPQCQRDQGSGEHLDLERRRVEPSTPLDKGLYDDDANRPSAVGEPDRSSPVCSATWAARRSARSRARASSAAGSPQPATKPTGDKPATRFEKLLGTLGKPAAIAIVSGEMNGYIEPCGCSDDQEGGLIRRYDLVERLRKARDCRSPYSTWAA